MPEPSKLVLTLLAGSPRQRLGRRWSRAADFANRSTVRAARTIVARKFGTDVLLSVALWLYFRSRVRTFAEVVQNVPHAHVG